MTEETLKCQAIRLGIDPNKTVTTWVNTHLDSSIDKIKECFNRVPETSVLRDVDFCGEYIDFYFNSRVAKTTDELKDEISHKLGRFLEREALAIRIQEAEEGLLTLKKMYEAYET